MAFLWDKDSWPWNWKTYVCIGLCNVRKLHLPPMLDGFLADSVNTTLASLEASCTTAALFSEVHDDWVFEPA